MSRLEACMGREHSVPYKERTVRPKALFMINSLTGGGAERVMSTLLGASKPWSDRYQIELAVLDDEPAAYDVPDWVKVHQLDCRQGMLASLMQVRKLVLEVRPDITLSFLTRANIANGFAHIGSANPWVISERVHTSAHLHSGLKAKLARGLIRVSYPRADRVIVVSHGVGDDLHENFGLERQKLHALDNPVDLARIRALAEQEPEITLAEPYVMGMGRFVDNKNFALLIEAFAKSAIAGKLLIVGEGPNRAGLEARVQALGLSERVVMPGFSANPFALLKRAQFFVLPSNAEGFPNSLVEAMAVGCPVISTNCNAGPSHILAGVERDEVDGLFMAPHGVLTPMNAVDPMAEALQFFQASHNRVAYAEAAKKRSEDFGAGAAAQAYWHVLEAAIASKRANKRTAGC